MVQSHLKPPKSPFNEQAAPAHSTSSRLTPMQIASVIKSEEFHVFEGTTVTVCLLTLANGAKVIGHNYGSIDPANQSWVTGKQLAKEMAVEKVWELEGYLLREKLATAAALL